MRVRFPPLKVFDFLALAFLVFIFAIFPVTDSAKPAVKSATTSPLIIPQIKSDAVPAPEISAKSVFIFDPDSGTEIYEKNSKAVLYPASTTKLMTALVALDAYNTDQVLTAKTAGQAVGSTIHLKNGDQLTVENLLYGLLVDSGNDAGVVLAENYLGGYSQFVAKMNEKARELGLSSTHFTNVSGLINDDHYTTTADLTVIARAAIRNAVIRKIVSTKSITITDITGTKKFFLESTNKLLGMDGVKGLKTGWTPESGECLVTLVTRDGKSILVTLLGSEDRFGESIKLINWVYDNFDWQQI